MTDQPTNVPTLLEQILHAQSQWQQMCWRMPMAMCGVGWLTAARGEHASAEVVDCAAHAQLAVPADDGDHALFA
jgi:hypothetical protein